MGNINYISIIVRLLEEPRKKISKKNILFTEVRAQFSEVRNKNTQTLVKLVFLGNLSQAVLNYYRSNDYLLIEGYLSIKNKYKSESGVQSSKYAEILVLKVYPFLLNLVRQISYSEDPL